MNPISGADLKQRPLAVKAARTDNLVDKAGVLQNVGIGDQFGCSYTAASPLEIGSESHGIRHDWAGGEVVDFSPPGDLDDHVDIRGLVCQ